MDGFKSKVLLADDEPEVLTMLEMTLLNDERYEILLARDGEEALAICEQETPTLAFLDVRMPQMSGVDVCRRLREHPKTSAMTVGMLAALAQDTDIDLAHGRRSQRVHDEAVQPVGALLQGAQRPQPASSGGHTSPTRLPLPMPRPQMRCRRPPPRHHVAPVGREQRPMVYFERPLASHWKR